MSLFFDNFKSEFIKDVMVYSQQEQKTYDASFLHISAKWLGYDIPEDDYIDGAGDRGIDFWYASENSLELFQVKSHELDENYNIQNKKFDNDGVNDLRRIKAFLLDEEIPSNLKLELRKIKERWNYIIKSMKSDIEFKNIEQPDPFIVKCGLIIIGNELTQQASEEFNILKRECEEVIILSEKVPVKFEITLLTLNDILNKKWREENREWKDIDGKSQKWIELRLDKQPENKENWISTSKSVVLYTPLIDLVMAYRKFGYQIFEPNVRCNIKKSKINSSIKESIKRQSSRKEFRYLNNGVTIICKSYEKPTRNRSSFKVNEPGIINGLQTIIAVSEAYEDLNNNEKEDFEKNCFVLIRLLQENAVRNIDDVVRTTNNQNKMESRNLFSNYPEQILYERLFAEIGWFYERKQGSWNAFSTDPSRWRTLNGKRKNDFSNGNKSVRKIDNEQIAQTWLSFIGFSEQAVHEKAELFETEERYKLIFLTRTLIHGHDTDYKLNEIKKHTIDVAPSHELLLISYLARDFAKEMTLSPKENFEKGCERLKINKDNMSKDEKVLRLTKEDPEYLLNSSLSGMSYIFVEFFGYILYKIYGENIHYIGKRLLYNGVIKDLVTRYSFEEIKYKVINEEFDTSKDIISVIWHLFREVIGQLLGTAWAESLRTATNRSRFLMQKETRHKIIQTFEDFNRYMTRVKVMKVWAAEINPPEGLYGFIKEALTL